MSLSVALRHRLPGLTLDIAFEAPPGVTTLFGRSGAGKTTVINAVAGLLRPDAGRIVSGGAVLSDSQTGIWLPPHRRRIGYVFQDARLFPHLSVRQNLTYGRWFNGGRRDADDMARILDLLGIEALLGRRPAALSGGEKQRVAIGRALLSRPRLLLLDEPMAALDEARKAEILPFIERLRDDARVPILHVSHSLSEVARLATTVIAIHDGRVVRAGPTADVLGDPEAVPTMGVRGAGALLTGRVIAHHDDGLSEIALSATRLFLPRVATAPGHTMRVRIAAQDVVLALDRPGAISALNILPATIVTLRQGQGPGVIVQLQSGQDRLLARITRRSADALGLAPGMACFGIVKSVSVAQDDIAPGPRPPRE
ncbi:molybdenum ABC transporter ATP-binding protein [Oceaniglobus indicus]|uniref:molybdenum ABC transporter ATP-binding protein n=1 Tax=Oceaniglobus indicus TaxID=2047749 RepID=UPI000C199799|nr:molybdenum ABC transporter ATP-binding protein [Oceaniglobus indicus]